MMISRRLVVFGGLALFTVAGFLGGNYAAMRFYARQAVRSGPPQTAPQDSRSLPAEPGRSRLFASADRSDPAGRARVFHEDVLFFPLEAEGPQFAVLKGEPAAEPADDAAPPLRREAAVPKPLPATDAAPIGRSAEAAIRELVERELPGVTPEAREIWHDELKNLSPEKARDLLQLRRQLGGAGSPWMVRMPQSLTVPFTPERTPDAPPHPPWPESSAAPPECALLPLAGPDADAHDCLASTLAALRQARAVLLNNVANAGTDGFKRSQVLLEEAPYRPLSHPTVSHGAGSAAPGPAVGQGVRVAGTRLDLAAGPLVKTGQPLDVAIAGEEFFAVRAGEQVVYTRAGRFTPGAGGELVLPGSQADRPLDPPVMVPEDAAAVRISPDGVVSAGWSGSDEQTAVGRIHTARFVNPAALEPLGGGLYAATEASGPPQIGMPGEGSWGKLHPRMLEGSNVDVEQELFLLKRLHRHWQALLEAATPLGRRTDF